MNDEDIAAHLAGLRIALAFAIKATCRSPAELQTRIASLQEIESLISKSLHPGIRDELDAIVTALGRLPVRDPAIQPASPAVAATQLSEHLTSGTEVRTEEGLLGELL